MKKIVLASGSPRRAKILKDLGVDFEVVKTDAPEVSYPADPERTVRENALAKGAALLPRKGVLSADTIVWFSGRIYGKPRDLEEAKEFLRELAGNVHTVFTGVAFDGEVKVVRSDVKFRPLSEATIEEYVAWLRRVYGCIRRNFPNAQIIFATTTGVAPGRYAQMANPRSNEELAGYNRAAKLLMAELGVPVNDLAAFSADFPIDYYADEVHFTEAGSRLLAGTVAGKIREYL